MKKRLPRYPKTPEDRLMVLEKIRRCRVENVLKLIRWKYDDLKELKEDLWNAYEETESEIIWENFLHVDEALQIKEEKEGIPWDMYF
jgi:hypothetical protein